PANRTSAAGTGRPPAVARNRKRWSCPTAVRRGLTDRRMRAAAARSQRVERAGAVPPGVTRTSTALAPGWATSRSTPAPRDEITSAPVTATPYPRGYWRRGTKTSVVVQVGKARATYDSLKVRVA